MTDPEASRRTRTLLLLPIGLAVLVTAVAFLLPNPDAKSWDWREVDVKTTAGFAEGPSPLRVVVDERTAGPYVHDWEKNREGWI